MQASQAQAAQGASQREETKSFARDSDGFDSVSKVSVITPKSKTGGSRAGDSVSYVSQVTGITTVSTKRKLEDLERQLNEER